ncbi:MAG: monooxygenase, partial [Novosphingobium sp.]|nr:monooxygenase [Novosphingobium sp.]
MTVCKLSAVPPPEEIDIAALKEKYRQERDKRIRVEGGEQYAPPTDALTHDTYAHDPFTPVVPRDGISEDIDVAILGGGWTGILSAYHLTQQGVTNFRNIDHAGNFGGTWYWNRYPGAMCDVESYVYLPLLEELGYMPKHKYSFAPEILEHSRNIAKHYRLYDDALLQTSITGMEWDEADGRWIISTDRGDR